MFQITHEFRVTFFEIHFKCKQKISKIKEYCITRILRFFYH